MQKGDWLRAKDCFEERFRLRRGAVPFSTRCNLVGQSFVNRCNDLPQCRLARPAKLVGCGPRLRRRRARDSRFRPAPEKRPPGDVAQPRQFRDVVGRRNRQQPHVVRIAAGRCGCLWRERGTSAARIRRAAADNPSAARRNARDRNSGRTTGSESPRTSAARSRAARQIFSSRPFVGREKHRAILDPDPHATLFRQPHQRRPGFKKPGPIVVDRTSPIPPDERRHLIDAQPRRGPDHLLEMLPSPARHLRRSAKGRSDNSRAALMATLFSTHNAEISAASPGRVE